MFLLLLIISIVTWLTARQFLKSKRLPPGPVSLPLIGNLHQIGYQLWRTGGIVPTLNHYRRQYGDVFTLWLGPIPHVNITDYDISHEVFVKNATKYADKHVPPVMNYVRHGNGIFFSNGEKWQELRRFSMLTMRNMGMGRDLMEEKIMAELNERCSEIDALAVNGTVVQTVNVFFDLTVGSVINNMLMGFRFDERNKNRFLTFKHMLDTAMQKFSPRELTLPVWILKKFFSKSFDSLVNDQHKILEYVSEDAVKRSRQYLNEDYEIDPDNVEDFVDAFLLKMKQDPNSDVYNEENLKILVLDLWITGQETTTMTLISAFIQFLNNPEIMEKVREELMKVTNRATRHLSLKDKNETPYFNATIAEIQRHASILNVNFWRINHEPTVIGGHPVDSGCLIASQLSVLHTNEQVFENPEQFDPERFLKNDKLIQQVIPFGIGKRSCLGEALAKAELYLIIGNLLLRYKFEPHGGIPSTEEVLPFTIAKRCVVYDMKFIKI
ncbi:hypothetical protein GCK72_018683 [Caenorhabditis remanei]|uniref:CYtochrome P450 family n=1 Tax=Caenorhabditis remanei TaxID=31234 RepID=A0A6A5GCK7_CAERE|nr:hypothetical protein GCK72_018683 [Caenorhabditis remanei]KAF1752129.1 hypothetical protein GCK72_018683 [Caenorhabditis remanei]